MNKTSHTEQMGTCDRHQLASDLEIGCACGPVAKCAKHASASKVEQSPNEEAKLHEEAARKIRDTFDVKPTTQDIAEFLQSFYGPRLRRENLCTKHGDNCSGYECGGVEQPAWEAHSGEDYSVVMRPDESTDNASIRVMSEDREELAEDIAALLNAPALRFQGELREAQARLEEFLLMKKRPADPTYFDMHHEAELREAIRNAGDGK